MKQQFNKNGVKMRNRKNSTTKANQVIYKPGYMEVLSRTDIARVHDHDYTVMAAERTLNINNLYVMLNTWLNLVADLGVDPTPIVASLLQYGLKTTLSDLKEYRHCLLAGEELPKYTWLSFLHSHDVKTVSFVCGFPKRTLIRESNEYDYWRDFRESNKGMRDRCWSPYLVSGLKSILEVLLRGYHVSEGTFILPPGSTCEGAHTYLEKFHIIKDQADFLRENGVRLPEFHQDSSQKPVNYCRYMTVPKDAFKRRGIAPEPVAKQVLAYRIDRGMRQWLPNIGVYLSDQERNQFAAFIGSLPANVDRELVMEHPLAHKYPEMVDEAMAGTRVATIDLSAASDSIRAQLVVDTIWGELYDQMYACRSPYVRFADEQHQESIMSYRWSTMGSANTFWLETIIFRAIKVLAYQYYNIFSEEDVIMTCLDTDYGDDSTIDVRVAPIYMDLLEAFGFKVNKDKSFWTGEYRESCGKEYLNGEDVTINFFPRGTSKYELPQLVSLQHKLYSYPRANSFLTECILELCPNITKSEAGSDSDDLWTDRYVRKAKRSSQYNEHKLYYTVQFGVVAVQPAVYTLKDKRIKDINEYLLSRSLDTPVWHCALPWTDDIIAVNRVLNQLAEIQIRSYPEYGVVYRKLSKETDNVVRYDREQCPDITEHTTFGIALRPLKPSEKDECELLMYLLTLGGGIEHVNNSPYTDTRDFIRDRRSLTDKGRFQVIVKPSFS